MARRSARIPAALTGSKRSRARCRHALTLAALACAVLGVWPPGPVARAEEAPPPPFRVIVDAKNPVSSLTRDFLTEAFLKKTTRWKDGETIRPVDLRVDSATRRKFSENVLKRSVSAVRSYWQQRIFSGRGVPPPELDSDEAVNKFVVKHRGAVGYVSGGAKLEDVKVVSVK
jgi:hypothetical protein